MKKIPLAFVIACVFFCCEEKLSSDKLIENSIKEISLAPDTIISILTKANCRGPQGNYSTEVNSGTDNYAYFKQVYTYRDSPYEAVVISNDSAFQVVNDSVAGALDKSTISIVKGHEFHKILLELKKRFHEFSSPEDENNLYRIKAQDDQNNPVEIFIEKESRLIRSFVFHNPADTAELITVSYSNWQQVQAIRLPLHVAIRQGKEKEFIFDYTSVVINSKNFEHWVGRKN